MRTYKVNNYPLPPYKHFKLLLAKDATVVGTAITDEAGPLIIIMQELGAKESVMREFVTMREEELLEWNGEDCTFVYAATAVMVGEAYHIFEVVYPVTVDLSILSRN